MDYQGVPTYGTDAVGQDAFDTVIAAAGGNRRFSNLILYCITNDAVVSVNGGVSGNIYVPAGQLVTVNDCTVTGAIQAKNATAGQNYASLSITAW